MLKWEAAQYGVGIQNFMQSLFAFVSKCYRYTKIYNSFIQQWYNISYVKDIHIVFEKKKWNVNDAGAQI